MRKATQPSEAPDALTATRPVEAPRVTEEVQAASQDVLHLFAVSGSEVQSPGPTGQSATTSNWSTSLTGVPAPSEVQIM